MIAATIMLSGGPRDGETYEHAGPFPPLYGRMTGRNTPDEVQDWYHLVATHGEAATYAFDETFSRLNRFGAAVETGGAACSG